MKTYELKEMTMEEIQVVEGGHHADENQSGCTGPDILGIIFSTKNKDTSIMF